MPTSTGESSGGSIGLGFAIPVDSAVTVADEIIATGRATHSYFGLQTVPVPRPPPRRRACTAACSWPAWWRAARPRRRACGRATSSPSIDGKPATSNIQLQEVTLTKNPGDTVELEYLRNGKTEKATVTLGTQP